MNIINQLFDEQFVIKLFKKRILPRYPDFIGIKNIKINPYKEHIWEKTYHVVIGYETTFITADNKIKKLPIVCTAHSDEPRKNVYSALKFLWDNSFAKGNLTIPRPLFYSNHFRATFYRGITGQNLYQFIRKNDKDEINKIVKKTAQWFAKLHNLPINNAKNFNKQNSRIKTVIPGVKHILNTIKQDYPQYYEAYQQIYKIILKQEKKFFTSNNQKCLIHGDAHPENVIKISKNKIALIDFTDICLSDFTRDLGSFLQQIEFMMQRKIGNKNYINKVKNIFLKNYLKYSGIELDENIKNRIDNYFNWTAMRTATFFLLKENPEPKRAHGLLVRICKDMKLDCQI